MNPGCDIHFIIPAIEGIENILKTTTDQIIRIMNNRDLNNNKKLLPVLDNKLDSNLSFSDEKDKGVMSF